MTYYHIPILTDKYRENCYCENVVCQRFVVVLSIKLFNTFSSCFTFEKTKPFKFSFRMSKFQNTVRQRKSGL